MTTFDRREESFENKYAHDEELRFRAIARRNRRLGAWAAEKLGKPAAEAEAYFKESDGGGSRRGRGRGPHS